MLSLLLAAATASTPVPVRGIFFPAPPGEMGGRFLEWAATPSAAQLAAAYPKGAEGRVAAALNCEVADDAGHLGPCTVWAQYPENAAAGKAALGLARLLQLAPPFAAVARQYHARASFTLALTPPGQPDAPFAGGACPPPFCTADTPK